MTPAFSRFEWLSPLDWSGPSQEIPHRSFVVSNDLDIAVLIQHQSLSYHMFSVSTFFLPLALQAAFEFRSLGCLGL